MIEDNRGEAAKVALSVPLLPVRSAEDTVEVNQRGRGLLIRPSVSPTVEVNLLKREVIENAAEASHHASVDVPVVFVFISIDQVEVPAQHPWTGAIGADAAYFLKERDLLMILLRPIYNGQPPRGISVGWSRDLGSERVGAEHVIVNSHHPALPGQ